MSIEHQISEAKQLLAAGWKQAAVAAHLGMSAATLSRKLSAMQAGESLAPKYQTGPRDAHELTEGEKAVVKLGMHQKRSRRLAAQMLMDSTACTDETFERLAVVFDRAAETRGDENWPTWFARACILTEEERNSFLGTKHLASVEPARPRGLFYTDAEGRNHPLLPNSVWEFDDESENTPWLEVDENGKPRLNRQTLKAIDVYSSFYLGMKAISRNSDGFRVEDQADFLLELVDAHGMPLRCRIERGPWDNNFWWGIPMPRAWWQTESCPSFRFGGIDTTAGGPIGVIQAFKSRHKGLVEGSFNHRQNLAAHETLDIGRTRGEHEEAARHLVRARAGMADAIARFPEASARADISADVLARFNNEAKRRRHLFGHRKVVPSELYATAVRRDLPANDRWRFLPMKVATTVRNAHIQVSVKDHQLPFLFTAEGFTPAWDWHAYLPHGWRVFAAFHPHRPELGCHIFNALHPDHAQNPARFPLGLPLGVLPLAERAPQFSDAPRDFAGRKATHAVIRSETRITKAAAKTVRVSTTIEAGRVRSMRKGSPDPLIAASLSPVTVQDHLDHGSPPVVDELTPETFERGALSASRGSLDRAVQSESGTGRGASRTGDLSGKSSGTGALPRARTPSLADLEAAYAEETGEF